MKNISCNTPKINCSQLEIACQEGISKATVRRILKTAMDKNIIEVRIKDSVLLKSALEQDLLSRFPIRRAVLVPNLLGNPQILMQDVCTALVKDLPRFIKNDSVLENFRRQFGASTKRRSGRLLLTFPELSQSNF